MNNKDINEKLAMLDGLNRCIENEFESNGGEITAETQKLLDRSEELKALLEGDGIDSLGRWLKGVEDRVKALKAERDSINRKIKAEKATMDYIKGQIRLVMDQLGIEKAKGISYSFTAYEASSLKLDADSIDADWLEVVTEAARNAGLPGYLDVAIDTSASRVSEWADEHEAEGAKYLHTETAPAVRFGKPRANKGSDVEDWE